MVLSEISRSGLLTESQSLSLCAEAFQHYPLDGKRVLTIIPDLTRTAPMDMLFRILYHLLADKVRALDFVIALGTHPPLSEQRINRRLGITQAERESKYRGMRFFNHRWDDSAQLEYIGSIPENEVAKITGGLMKEKVDITVNKLIFEYDLLILVGPTFPHEVAGFSGGNKYFFPGISGPDVLHMFHWLGALVTSLQTIGIKDTPVRRVIDRAASFIRMDKISLNLVVKNGGLAGLFIGSPEEAWSKAVALSKQLHIIYKDHPYQRVLAQAPKMYEDLWTGAKCMYKLEPVVADGGRLIIYAPHIQEISLTHGDLIRKVGYHVLDYFLSQPEKFRHIPRAIRAHSTHLKGFGSFANGVERPRIDVVLATQIPEEVCKDVNLGYTDPREIRLDDWKNREDEGILYMDKAGEILYRLSKDKDV